MPLTEALELDDGHRDAQRQRERGTFDAAKSDMGKKTFTTEQARSIGEAVGIDWRASPFDVEQFRMGLDIELEHGLVNRQTNVTSSDPIITGKIALAHLQEFPDYYTRLARMEAEAEGKPLR